MGAASPQEELAWQPEHRRRAGEGTRVIARTTDTTPIVSTGPSLTANEAPGPGRPAPRSVP